MTLAAPGAELKAVAERPQALPLMPREHVLEDVPGMEGLSHCPVCGGAEGSLPTECPGAQVERRVVSELLHDWANDPALLAAKLTAPTP